MRGVEEIRVIEENVEELIAMLAEHTHLLEWDIDFIEQTLREIHTNIKRLRKMRG